MYNNQLVMLDGKCIGVIGRADNEATDYTFIAGSNAYWNLEDLPRTATVKEFAAQIEIAINK